MIFSENRYPLFRIMLKARKRHALDRSDRRPDSAADRRAADVALQLRLGLLPRWRARAGPDHRIDSGAIRQNLSAVIAKSQRARAKSRGPMTGSATKQSRTAAPHGLLR